MDVFYVKDINQSYMILSEEEAPEMDYQVQMLEKNQILGLLPFHMKQVDRQIQYCYEISGKLSVRKWAEENKLKYDQVKILIQSLSNTMEELEAYLLSAQCIILEEEYIYIDTEDWIVSFCYYPPNSQKNEDGLRSLLQFILKKIDHRDSDAVFLAYRLFQESLNDNISLRKLQIIVERKESDEWNLSRKQIKTKENEEQHENEDVGKEFENESEYEKEERNEAEEEIVDNTEEKMKRGFLPIWNNKPQISLKRDSYEPKKEKAKTSDSTEEISNRELKWKLPERLGVSKGDSEHKRIANETVKAEDGDLRSDNRVNEGTSTKGSVTEKIWMAVPFITLIGVIVLFSGKVIEMQKVWAKYPWICIGILLFTIGSNFIIVKRWYFDEE